MYSNSIYIRQSTDCSFDHIVSSSRLIVHFFIHPSRRLARLAREGLSTDTQLPVWNLFYLTDLVCAELNGAAE